MRVSVILGHPRPGSFNHALADAVIATLSANGHEVAFHDLYQEDFDPVAREAEIPRDAPLDPVVRRHCDEIAAADGIVVIHPNWWGQPPAILKGWVDRVLRPGIAYRFAEVAGGEGLPVGLLVARVALVLNSSNTSLARELREFGDPLQLIWKNCTFDLCGVPRFDRRVFAVLVTSSAEQRAEWLAEARALVERHFPPESGA